MHILPQLFYFFCFVTLGVISMVCLCRSHQNCLSAIINEVMLSTIVCSFWLIHLTAQVMCLSQHTIDYRVKPFLTLHTYHNIVLSSQVIGNFFIVSFSSTTRPVSLIIAIRSGLTMGSDALLNNSVTITFVVEGVSCFFHVPFKNMDQTF